MSLEDLQADLESNLAAIHQLAAAGALTTAPEVVDHLAKFLWPFMQNVVNEMAEIDAEVANAVYNADDHLQPETAEQLAAVIVIATGLIGKELQKRLDPKKPADAQVLVAIRDWAKLAKEAGEIIEEITVEPPEGEDDPDQVEAEMPDSEDDEDDDDDDEDDDETDGEDA